MTDGEDAFVSAIATFFPNMQRYLDCGHIFKNMPIEHWLVLILPTEKNLLNTWGTYAHSSISQRKAIITNNIMKLLVDIAGFK